MKKIGKSLAAVLFLLIWLSPVLLSEYALAATIPEERQKPLLVDEADLLTDEQEEKLLSRLEEISERQQCDVAIVTVNSIGRKTIRSFADDFFDYNGYGWGSADDGLILVVDMDTRQWWISTHAYAVTAFTDAGIAYIGDKVARELAGGDNNRAFEKYASLCDDFLTQAKTGQPYDTGHLPKEKPGLFSLLLALCIGAVPGLIVVTVMRSKLKTVKLQGSANQYLRGSSLHITKESDVFLYSKVSQTLRPKPTESHSSSGSSTHTSSSGRSHGGGGGHF